jgi:hypothetical protein
MFIDKMHDAKMFIHFFSWLNFLDLRNLLSFFFFFFSLKFGIGALLLRFAKNCGGAAFFPFFFPGAIRIDKSEEKNESAKRDEIGNYF